ncbi:MAG: homoserine dehydrogenase [Faecalicoccus sp.]|nr:homoserine dehydrogenase [Faecalicoccus sp.]
MINVAVMGYGTIGSGVVRVLDMNADLIAKRVKDEVKVKYILDLRQFDGDPYAHLLTNDFNQIIEDENLDIVVETIGGTGAAYMFVKAALEAGKSVATSNKALVAKHGPELMQIAKDKNVSFLFEASVGGGIPILRTLQTALTGDDIEEITGIVNGTTNFILSKMANSGANFDEVLKEAQELGYAELDPTDDIEGYDAGRKIAIMTSLVSGKQVSFENIYVEGISKLTAQDMEYATALGRSIKLLATSVKSNGTYSVMVAPFMLESSHPLYMVEGVFNAIFVKGNALGDSMYYGSGAGSLPTASAVVADIVDIAKHLHTNIDMAWSKEEAVLGESDDSKHAFFVRVKEDVNEDQIVSLFGNVEYVNAGIPDEFGFVTGVITEKEAREKLKNLPVISKIRLA